MYHSGYFYSIFTILFAWHWHIQCSFAFVVKFNRDLPSKSTSLGYGREDDVRTEESFTSPVLKQVYPKLLEWKETYGHPNIPLGSSEGRKCRTLRRLHIQKKLTDKEVEWLDDLGFTFHSLEDVYKDADFDELFARLMAYEERHPESNFQVPKKLKEDPELGAWVTGIRRLKKEGVDPEHAKRLDSVGFAWVSSRKCGSKFMLKYKEYKELVSVQGLGTVLKDPEVLRWIKAQQETMKRDGLSNTRIHYMEETFGVSWTSIETDTK